MPHGTRRMRVATLCRQNVIAAKYNAICMAMHDVSTEEGKASCRADRENGCFPPVRQQGCERLTVRLETCRAPLWQYHCFWRLPCMPHCWPVRC